MKMVDKALSLAKEGFYVFPLPAGKKAPPLFDDFPNKATRDPATIKKWWQDRKLNIGISTSKFGDNEALVAVDVDDKPGRDGFSTMLDLEISQGKELPVTYRQVTPTGGHHYIYRFPIALRQGVDVLGKGMDIRSKGGYIVGRGSIVNGKEYTNQKNPIVMAPEWLVTKLGEPRKKNFTLIHGDISKIDKKVAVERAIDYLENHAPISIKGQGGDQTAYKVAAHVKDFGLDPKTCCALMLDHWNDRCPPGWPEDRLLEKINHAYTYGLDPVGSAAPELQFEKIPKEHGTVPSKKKSKTKISKKKIDQNPIDKFNDDHAVVIHGGKTRVMWKTTNHKGQYVVRKLGIEDFHTYNANKTMSFSGKVHAISKLWINSPNRRTYEGLVFSPAGKVPERFYNSWRGFSVDPAIGAFSPEQKEAVDMFLEHAWENISQKDEVSYKWLMGFMAHMIQHPEERPSASVVFKGQKGIGKSILTEILGELVAQNYMATADDRYIVGNFNSHLEENILFVLEEAFWSGNKKAESILKNLITGKKHRIEFKGKESYATDSYTRLFIIGNERWLVPATVDERRFCVFNVGDKRMEDNKFFKRMWELMTGPSEGLKALLNYLLDYDLSDFNPHKAPKTQALLEQKIESLSPFHEFWFECLGEGRIIHGDFGENWPVEVEKEYFRSAFIHYHHERQVKGRVPHQNYIGKMFKECFKSVDMNHKNDKKQRIYKFSTLETARDDFEKFMGHKMKWEG